MVSINRKKTDDPTLAAPTGIANAAPPPTGLTLSPTKQNLAGSTSGSRTVAPGSQVGAGTTVNPNPQTPPAPSPQPTTAASPPNPTPFTGPNPDPTKRGAQGDPNDTDALIQQYVNQALHMDTSGQQALIQQMEQEQLGKQLVNQRASMGRAGFGASGALAGMESDARRQAAHQAASDIFGVQQQAFQNAGTAISADVAEQNAAAERAREEAYNTMIAGILGGSPDAPKTTDPPPPPASSETGKGGATVNGLDPRSHVTTDSSTLASGTAPTASSTQGAPSGHLTLTKTDADGTQHYTDANGTKWTHPAGAGNWTKEG